MDTTNILYTIAQIGHNFGAIAVVGGSFFAYWSRPKSPSAQKNLAWMILIGWSVQGLSGAGFGAISYIFHGQFPEIHGIAKAALLIKILCTMLGFSLTIFAIYSKVDRNEKESNSIWKWIFSCAATALFAAAFLRWFS